MVQRYGNTLRNNLKTADKPTTKISQCCPFKLILHQFYLSHFSVSCFFKIKFLCTNAYDYVCLPAKQVCFIFINNSLCSINFLSNYEIFLFYFVFRTRLSRSSAKLQNCDF